MNLSRSFQIFPAETCTNLYLCQVIVPGDAKGGRFVRWGGLHGRLCLADGDLALEDSKL